ncbi:hypothetical protein ACFL3J_01140 [Candidatus Omnitrophota bacterium]
MGKHCCGGKNAYKPISRIRYFVGLVMFYLLHINLRVTLYLRHTFIRRYPHYESLVKFHRSYFKNTFREILEQKGMEIQSGCKINEKKN